MSCDIIKSVEFSPEIQSHKAVLTKEDYEKVKIYQSVYNYAKDILKDDAIRSQDKYSKHEDYGPKRVKIFDSSKGLQYVAVIGYTDNEYEYSDTKDTATITVSRPLTADEAELESGRYGGIISNANALTGNLDFLNYILGITDMISSKINPLYNQVGVGDVIITIKNIKVDIKELPKKNTSFITARKKTIFIM